MKDTSNEVKLAMAGVALSHALICALVNEGIIDRNRLAAWFFRLVDDLPEAERQEPRGLVLKKIADELTQPPPPGGKQKPSWSYEVIEGGSPPKNAS